MCPPFGSDETIMAYEMPLGGGIHRISSQATAVAAYLVANTPGASGELDHSHISGWRMPCEALG